MLEAGYCPDERLEARSWVERGPTDWPSTAINHLDMMELLFMREGGWVFTSLS
jgi:hypothetical protein